MEKLNKWLVRHKKAFRDGSRYLVEHSINVKDILNGKLESELLPRLISDINEVIDRTNHVPKCNECGKNMKPHSMFFDESYSEHYYRKETVDAFY